MQDTARAPGEVRKIAVLRANALGDFIFTLPALQALKNTWPAAELTLLGQAWHREFLDSRPGPVDRVISIPKCHGVPHETDRPDDPQQVERFFDAMHAESFDIALQMHGGGGNSNPFVKRLGARFAVGLQAPGAPALDVNIPYVLYHNEVLRYLEVAMAAGAVPTTVVPTLEVTAADVDALAREAPQLRRPLVVLHPGASDLRRRWPAQKMAALADVLSASGLTVCVTGVAAERALVDDVVRHATSHVVDLGGKLSLRAMTALLARAELVVSNDTGPLHLARAVGTATIGIYWFGNVINAGPIQMRGHRHAVAWTTHCPACGMDCIHGDAHVPHGGCAHEVSFVDAVSVAEMADLAAELLGTSLDMPRLAAL